MQDGMHSAILEVADLSTVFETRDGTVFAVNGVSFTLAPGEMLGVVGESGSGKSVTMMSMLNLLPSPPARTTSQHIHFEGGAIITDQIFRVNGLGQLLIIGIQGADIPLVQTLSFVFAVLIVLFNLIADLLYGILDPRIRYD